ncbi:MAG: energy transducer TonB [Candidatus Dactylopiibacterium sp.]|nr:energy transducer TonB [Candidatus Dactylopiibacterium sp.]
MRSLSLQQPLSERALSLVLVVGLHLAVGAALVTLAQPVIRQVFTPPLRMELVTAPEPKPEVAAPQPEPPKPLPMKQSVKPQPRPAPPKPAPAPVLQTEAPAPANNAAIITAPPPPKEMPPAAPPPAAVAGPTQEALQAPRHDADHLHNPKPPYPRSSVALAEEGTVWLRVQVSEDGRPLQVLIDKGSGFPRLDRSARDTVASAYRFQPARLGERAVVGWVRFPIQFQLDR